MTVSRSYCSEDVSVYPGVFEPLHGAEELLTGDTGIAGNTFIKPPANISELDAYYRIEMAVPGFEKEDFFIRTYCNLLSVSGKRARAPKRDEEYFSLKSFTCECISRDFALPPDADTEFATAEYREGILVILVSKSNHPGINRPGRIVVY